MIQSAVSEMFARLPRTYTKCRYAGGEQVLSPQSAGVLANAMAFIIQAAEI